jgi:hypothetical protein
MATTTNYGWTTPDDTALVKDGAAAIRTLGSSVDTTTKALNPSTTLGDIEYRSSTANTNTRLGIGSTGNVLTVAGGVPSWAAPASSSPTSATAYIGTSQSTTSTTFTDLTTAGPAVTITTGTKAIALITARFGSPAGGNARMGITVSGSSSITASDDKATSQTVSNDDRWSLAIPYTTLTAGSNTFTCKYRTGGGTGTSTFEQREITVIDLGS